MDIVRSIQQWVGREVTVPNSGYDVLALILKLGAFALIGFCVREIAKADLSRRMKSALIGFCLIAVIAIYLGDNTIQVVTKSFAFICSEGFAIAIFLLVGVIVMTFDFTGLFHVLNNGQQ